MLLSRLRPRLLSSELIRSGVTSPTRPLTACDVMTGPVGVPLFYVYRQGLDVDLLRRTMKAVAAHHPGVTGRLQRQPDGQLVLAGNDQGVSLRLWACDGPLPSYGPHHPMHRDALRYVKPIFPWQAVRRQLPLVQLEVFRFADGGTVLVVHAVHALFDASSVWNFLMDWSRLARGLDIAGPVVERDLLFDLMQPLADRAYTRGVLRQTSAIVNARLYPRLALQALQNTLGVYRVPAHTIEGWRRAVPEGDRGRSRASTADLVTAHALKLLSAVQGHDRDRMVGLVSDLRYRKALGLPHRLLGNALAQESMRFTGQALRDRSEAELAAQFKQPGAVHNAEETLDYLGLLERHRRQGTLRRLMPEAVLEAEGGFIQNNYSHLPIYEVDLGTGAPQWFNPMAVPFRMLKITPTPSGDGSVDLHLTVSRAELAPFEARYGASRL